MRKEEKTRIIRFIINHELKMTQQVGMILVSVIIFAAIAVTITIGLVNWGASLLRSVETVAGREQALQIAEAGIDYYRWHLAQAPTDFYDGTGGPSTSPYVHQFSDKDGNLLGTYALNITPPSVGSTLVTIISKGTLASSTISRTIKAIMAIPSFAQYAVVANDDITFDSDSVTYGTIFSNKEIHFDGVAHGLVESALSAYTGSGSMVGLKLGMPAIDFGSITASISVMKAQAQSGGVYLNASQYNGDPAFGYHVVLKTDNTFDLYVVTAVQGSPNNICTSAGSAQTQWGLWTINTQQFLQNYPIPANGIVFSEDNVWVDGTINHSRISIVTARLPDPGINSRPNIIINNDLLYTNTDGTDAIGLVAQGNINIGYGSGGIQTIDAALIAQNGRVGRYHYVLDCGSYYDRTTLNLFGTIATNERYGFAYNDGTGYANRNVTYDANLLYNPPPSFPLTSSHYNMLSWQEI